MEKYLPTKYIYNFSNNLDPFVTISYTNFLYEEYRKSHEFSSVNTTVFIKVKQEIDVFPNH